MRYSHITKNTMTQYYKKLLVQYSLQYGIKQLLTYKYTGLHIKMQYIIEKFKLVKFWKITINFIII